MKHYVRLLAILIILFSSCKQNKDSKREALILPVNVVALDTVSANNNWHVYYAIKVISPLPESLFVPRYESKEIPGDTAIYYFKYATEVPDSSKSFVSKYEFHPLGDFSVLDHSKKVIRLQFWRDSTSAIDTILRFK
jgi:hypothetical protein